MNEIEVKKSDIEKSGVFALQDFAIGESVYQYKHGKFIGKKEVALFSQDEQDHTEPVDGSRYEIMTPPARFVNHSCDPNIVEEVTDNNRTAIALRNIKKGEELTVDYRIRAYDDWVMECNCKSKSCNGKVIGNFFSLPSNLQVKYIQYAPDFIQKEYTDRNSQKIKPLQNFDPIFIQLVISRDFLDLKIEKITLIDNGWDNVVVEINDNIIFRFPKDNNFTFYKNDKTSFDTEVEILGILKNKISLQIPKIEFLGKSLTYMGYPKIQGGSLTTEIFDSLNSEQKEKLTFDLANFLREIHASISPDEARKIGVVNEDLPSYSRSIKSVLPNKIKDKPVLDFMESTIEEYDGMIQEKVESVFLYNDLHTENMAFDATAKKLNGVFDFGDIMIGDVNIDFYPLYKFDPYFMKAVAEKYQELTGRKLNLRRMVICGRINELSDLAEFINQPESTVYKNAILRIEKWNKELDLFKA